MVYGTRDVIASREGLGTIIKLKILKHAYFVGKKWPRKGNSFHNRADQ